MNVPLPKKKRGAKAYRSGLWAEALARLVLRLKFYRILAIREKTPLGEIDIIARRGHTIAFIEVKARGNLELACGAVSSNQKNRLTRAAAHFMARHPAFNQYYQRFDMILITPRSLPRHIKNAF